MNDDKLVFISVDKGMLMGIVDVIDAAGSVYDDVNPCLAFFVGGKLSVIDPVFSREGVIVPALISARDLSRSIMKLLSKEGCEVRLIGRWSGNAILNVKFKVENGFLTELVSNGVSTDAKCGNSDDLSAFYVCLGGGVKDVPNVVETTMECHVFERFKKIISRRLTVRCRQKITSF